MLACVATAPGAAQPGSTLATDLSEPEIIARLAPEGLAARRIALDLAREPITWPGEGERLLGAAALHAVADIAAAQARVEACDAGLVRLREIAAALARGEDAGDNAGLDRVDAERETALVEARRTDAREALLRAHVALAAMLDTPLDPATRVRARAVTGRPALPSVPHLVERALSLVAENPVPATAPPPPRRGGRASTSPAPDESRTALAEARRAEIRVTVTSLAALVAERRAAVAAFQANGVAAADAATRIVDVAYENGGRPIADVLIAYRALVDARVRLADLELAARRTEIDLEALTGESLP